MLNTIPLKDGFYMPAEYSHHRGCMMIWPVRPGSWTNAGAEAKKAFADIARAIAKSEEVWMLSDHEYQEEVKREFRDNERIHPVCIESNDAWARDVGPTCVINDSGEVRGISWRFNAWGGDVDGLYADWTLDDRVALGMCQELDIKCYDAGDFVLEGGSVHSDGEGTVLVTEACLLSGGRNPGLTKEQIEEKLKNYLGASKIIWLPRGIYNDETNEHVDNVCAFTAPANVVLAWTEDKSDPQWGLSNESLKVLENETDAKGRKITVHKLPIPEKSVCITKEELDALEFEPGEDVREAGERLAASYVNFYISNGAVIVPQFGDSNDKVVVDILGRLFKDREIIPIDARPVIVGGGNIHCITQQIPG